MTYQFDYKIKVHSHYAFFGIFVCNLTQMQRMGSIPILCVNNLTQTHMQTHMQTQTHSVNGPVSRKGSRISQEECRKMKMNKIGRKGWGGGSSKIFLLLVS